MTSSARPRTSHPRWTVTAALPLLAFVPAACGDGEPLLFPPPDQVHLEGPDQVEGGAGMEAPIPSFRVVDGRGNPAPGIPVTFRVEEGGGSVSPTGLMTDEEGRVRPEWILGDSVGPNVLVADLAELGELRVEAFAHPPVEILGIHLNQASQEPARMIPGVAGRPGLLRVVARARVPNTVRPDALFRLYQDGEPFREVRVPLLGVGVPPSPNLAIQNHTWNLALSGDEVVPGLGVEVMVDPDGTDLAGPRDGLAWPGEGGPASFDVEPIPPLRLVVFPIHSTQGDRTGSFGPGNASSFLQNTRRWIPLAEVEYEVRGPFSSSADLTEISGWTELLQQLLVVRLSEADEDEYYHGIVPDVPGIAVAGIAYVLTDPSHPARAGLSFDRLPQASGTLAHELAHNMGRLHAPCGNPPGVDGNFPHLNARLGSPGYDVLGGGLVTLDEYRDFMSYCGPRWTSDYTWRALVEWRRSDSLAPEASAFAAHAAPGPGLLVWGRITSSGVELHPAFALDEVTPSLPDRVGPHRVRGWARDGRELFQLWFQGDRPAHVADPQERHFTFLVPLNHGELDELARIEVDSPAGRAERTGAGAAADPPLPDAGPPLVPDEPRVVVEPLGQDRLRLRWEGERFSMALVRDRSTGRVLGIGAGGELPVAAPPGGRGDLEVLLSDGVRSRGAAPR